MHSNNLVAPIPRKMKQIREPKEFASSDESELIRNDCPANHGLNGCIITGMLCQYKNYENCSDYRNYVPKRNLPRAILEHLNQNVKVGLGCKIQEWELWKPTQLGA